MRKLLTVLVLLLLCAVPLCALAASGQISGTAWLDTGESPEDPNVRLVSGVAVTLCRLEQDGSETQVAKAVTGSGGAYSFEGLPAGSYRLRATLPEGSVYSLPRAGGSVMMPAAGYDSFSLPIQLEENQQITDAHIGVTRGFSYIKAIAFEDLNQNGGRSTAEPFLKGIEVSLYYEWDGEWILIDQAKTDHNGEALFMRLTPGTYRVGAVLPAPYIVGPLGEKTTLWYNCIPPQEGDSGWTDPVFAPRGDSVGIGIGAVTSGSLTGSLWQDDDLDGKKDAGESGFAGAALRLVSESLGVERETQPAADGSYRFDGLLAGEYTLYATLPEDKLFTVGGGDSLIAEVSGATGHAQVTVEAENEVQAAPIGVIPAASLTVHLYNDMNVNGIFDPEEPVFAGASLTVIQDGRECAQVLSDGEGTARVTMLRAEETVARLTLPDGQVFTCAGDQNDFAALAAVRENTAEVTLQGGRETVLYAGVTLPAAVSGMVFDDEDLSGIKEDSETGLAGFTVQAIDSEGRVVAETETGEDGRYTLNNLLPTPHLIRFSLADAYVFTAYSDAGAPVENHVISQETDHGDTAELALAPGQSVSGICGGVFRSATVSGQVLLNTGIPSRPAQGGMEGVLVTLLDAEGTPVSDTTNAYTDAEGSFYLKGALPGTYRLRFTLPKHAAFTELSLRDTVAMTDLIELHAADDLQCGTVNAVYTAVYSGSLYRDANLSGQMEAGEEPLAGVTLQMENTDLNLIYMAVTEADGSYSFEDLRPGSYTLSLSLPEGLCFGYDASSPLLPQTRSQGESQFVLEVGDRQETRNIAVAAPASLSGRVYLDTGDNGIWNEDADPGAAGLTLSFTGQNGIGSYTLQTDENGRFSLPSMVPGVYSLRATLPGDCVPDRMNPAQLKEGFWTSSLTLPDGDTAQLAYGILRYARVGGHIWNLDGSKTAIEGRAVTLYQEGAEEPLATAFSNENGYFAFEQLRPGRYRLACELPDERYLLARPADAVLYPYETPDVPVGEYGFFDVAMGQKLDYCDIGIGAMGAVGDTAWLDLNGNGLQDGVEPALPGIHIALYQYGELAAEADTDSQGRYLISNLYPGAYTLVATFPAEVTPTQKRTDYPLAASVLIPGEGQQATAEGVIVPSAGRNLNCDLGFVLRQEGKYPASLEERFFIDWSFDGKRK